mgnify:CR=1 FL=1
MQMKNERISEQWSKETTCTARTNSSYTLEGNYRFCFELQINIDEE